MSALDQSVLSALQPAAGAGPEVRPQTIDANILQALNPATQAPAQPQQPQQSLYQEVNNDRMGAIRGAAEAVGNWATGTAGQIVSGWRGVLGMLDPNETADQTVAAMRGIQNWFENTPQNDIAKRIESLPGEASAAVESAGNKVVPGLGTAVTQPGKVLGNAAADLAEKAGLPPEAVGGIGAAASVLPMAEGLALGARNADGGVSASPADERAPLDQGGGIESEPGSTRMVGGGAAVANNNPYPALSGEEATRGPYPIIKLSKVAQDVPQQEQDVRSAIAGQILENPDRVRSGVITGNVDTLRNEYEQARAANPTPAGMLLKQKIADEQNSLSNYATNQVQETGANPHFVDDYQRGDFLNSVMFGPDGIKGLIDGQKKAIYDQAMQASGGVPVQTAALDALRLNPQFGAELQLAGQKDFLGGMSNLIDMAKTQGFEGAPAGSVAAMERLRQAVNRQWSPQNRYFVGRVVDAIDNDVASAGGPGLLAQARGIHQAEKTLFGSPGIKKLFGDVDPNGVQSATPFEKIPQTLNNMPFDQWRHVFDTYDAVANGRIPGTELEVPQDIQAAAQQAKSEIAGSLVREVRNAGAQNIGVWNANAANKILNARAQKLSLALDPEQQQAMHTLNLGGQLMPGQFSYEGAAQQGRRLNMAGLLERTAPQIGASIGGMIPIPGSEWLGGKVGEKVGSGIQLRRQMKQARELDAQMEANAKRGQ